MAESPGLVRSQTSSMPTRRSAMRRVPAARWWSTRAARANSCADAKIADVTSLTRPPSAHAGRERVDDGRIGGEPQIAAGDVAGDALQRRYRAIDRVRTVERQERARAELRSRERRASRLDRVS